MASPRITECIFTIKCDDIVDLDYNDESLIIAEGGGPLASPIIDRSETGDWVIKFSYKPPTSQIVTGAFDHSVTYRSRICALRPLVEVSKPPQNGYLIFSIICSRADGAAFGLDVFVGNDYLEDYIWIGSENILNYHRLDGSGNYIYYCLLIIVPRTNRNYMPLDIYKIESSTHYSPPGGLAGKPGSLTTTLDLRHQS